MIGLPDEIKELIEQSHGEVLSFRSVGGGSINAAGKVETSQGRFFIKWNNTRRFPGMFQAEKHGLEILGASGEVHVPGNLQVLEGSTNSGLITAYIETVRGDTSCWEKAGVSLARMHLQQKPWFGLDHDNYMGSLHQSNTRHESFTAFFMQERLLPQVRLALDRNLLKSEQADKFYQLDLGKHFQDEPACLVHGDLWGGNIIFDSDNPYLIDPAVAWSSRHVDLSMSTMFGRFPEAFYRAYNHVYPYTAEEQELWELIKLYPLLIHVNLFGRSYLHETLAILNHYT